MPTTTVRSDCKLYWCNSRFSSGPYYSGIHGRRSQTVVFAFLFVFSLCFHSLDTGQILLYPLQAIIRHSKHICFSILYTRFQFHNYIIIKTVVLIKYFSLLIKYIFLFFSNYNNNLSLGFLFT